MIRQGDRPRAREGGLERGEGGGGKRDMPSLAGLPVPPISSPPCCCSRKEDTEEKVEVRGEEEGGREGEEEEDTLWRSMAEVGGREAEEVVEVLEEA